MLPYKEFTDEEIIKAVECCSEPCCVCDECPLYCVGVNCSSFELHRYALDLINRQKSEIERLNKKVEELSDVLSDTIRIRYAEAKTEAYKEFAEKLKENAMTKFDWNDYIDIEEVDNILKEMMGDKQ